MMRGSAEHRYWKEQYQIRSMIAAVLRGERVMFVATSPGEAERMMGMVRDALAPIETDLLSAKVLE